MSAGSRHAGRLSALVADNLSTVRRRIEAAGGAGRVEVLAVTKGFGSDAVVAAMEAGCRMIGENYAQELLGKLAEVERPWPEVHFIGRLQSRKVRTLTDVVSVWQSIDRDALVDEVAHRAGPATRVMVQVNVSGEAHKGGCLPDQADPLVARARAAGLDVVGLMAVGRTGTASEARAGFRILRGLADSLGIRHCSMGMSEDLEVAVEEGSTMVRVGTALFGERPRRIDTPK